MMGPDDRSTNQFLLPIPPHTLRRSPNVIATFFMDVGLFALPQQIACFVSIPLDGCF